MAVTNAEIVALLRRIADMLEIKGEVVYKALAYRRVADNIESLGRDVADVWREGGLRKIPGVGDALEDKLDELLRTGRLEYYEELEREVPMGVLDLLEIPAIGPKKARLLWQQLGITSIAEAEQAARRGRLRDLPGMGARSEQRILEGIESLYRRMAELPLGVALPIAQDLVNDLRRALGVTTVEAAGSLRRRKATVGDIDLLAAFAAPPEAIAAFVTLPEVAEVVSRGPTRATVLLENGLQVDLRALVPERYGSALQYFTGSKSHNVALRGLALSKGLSLSEYGLIEGEREILCPAEEDVYAALGLPWIPPELREDRGEIEAALHGDLPHLVDRPDLQGDLHVHTNWSDGHVTLTEMVAAADELGYRYIAITDHSSGMGIAGGMNVDRLRAQWQEIALVAPRFPNVRILRGAEVEVRADGTLDYPDEVLQEMDLVVAAMHAATRANRDTAVRALTRAMQNPYVHVIAHPSGRLLGQREGIDEALPQLIETAAATGTILEINGTPSRLDLDDVHIRAAIDAGVPLCISSDAHDPLGLRSIDYGLVTARRGWAEPEHIINTWPLEQLLTLLDKKRRAQH